MIRRPPRSPLFPSPPLSRSARASFEPATPFRRAVHFLDYATGGLGAFIEAHDGLPTYHREGLLGERLATVTIEDRKSTRLNSSHSQISYAVFCLKKKKDS